MNYQVLKGGRSLNYCNMMNQQIYDQLKNIPDDYAKYHLQNTIHLMDERQIAFTKDILDRFISIIPDNLSRAQKAALLYEVIIRKTHYSSDVSSESKFVFVSALLSQKAVCMGIAELYGIFCNWIGIPCRTIVGYAWNGDAISQGRLHAWNLVKLPTKAGECWFHCDPTWDLSELNYTYNRFFLKSDTYMKNNRHIWLEDKYPLCCNNYLENIFLDEKGVAFTCHILDQVIASSLKTKE